MIIEGVDVFVGVIDFDGDYFVFGLIELYIDNFECYIEFCFEVDWLYLLVLIVYDVELVLIGIIMVFDVMCVGLIYLGKGCYIDYV